MKIRFNLKANKLSWWALIVKLGYSQMIGPTLICQVSGFLAFFFFSSVFCFNRLSLSLVKYCGHRQRPWHHRDVERRHRERERDICDRESLTGGDLIEAQKDATAHEALHNGGSLPTQHEGRLLDRRRRQGSSSLLFIHGFLSQNYHMGSFFFFDLLLGLFYFILFLDLFWPSV